jgi:hypothetical protein
MSGQNGIILFLALGQKVVLLLQLCIKSLQTEVHNDSRVNRQPMAFKPPENFANLSLDSHWSFRLCFCAILAFQIVEPSFAAALPVGGKFPFASNDTKERKSEK